MTSYHEYNKIEKGRILVRQMLEGQNVALITCGRDARHL